METLYHYFLNKLENINAIYSLAGACIRTLSGRQAGSTLHKGFKQVVSLGRAKLISNLWPIKPIVKFLCYIVFITPFISGKAANITFNYTGNTATLSSGTYDNIILNRGAFVVIQNASIFMNTGKSITINKGAVLKITNSTITHAGSGNSLWTGMNIIGDENSYQMPQNYNSNLFFNDPNDNYNTMQHGLLYCSGSTISYANSAVNSSGATGGGCINIANCIFDNNVNSITLTNYSKFHQTSSIVSTTFNNTAYLPSGITYYHISIKDASISNSSFLPVYDHNMYYALEINNCYLKNDLKYKNLSGINVTGSFISIHDSYFYNLGVGMNCLKGVYVYSGISINGSHFEDCDRGIIASGLYTVAISSSTIDINRSIQYDGNNTVVPIGIPVGIFISGNTHYNINNCWFEKATGFTPNVTGSYAIIADGNSSLSGNIISNNTIITVYVGVQSQNESLASFLKCNKFSLGSASTATFNYDITIPNGTLAPHNGCGGGGVYYNQIPGNTFSPNAVNVQRNIFTNSSSYTTIKPFQYKYSYSKTEENPQHYTPLKVKATFCGNNAVSNCGTVLALRVPFHDNYNGYQFAFAHYDSLLQTNSADTDDIEATRYFKNYYLGEIMASITDTNQLDSAITLLAGDTSFAAKYHLLLAYIANGRISQAWQVLNNLEVNAAEEANIKQLYTLLLPIYSNYNFDSLNAQRTELNLLAQDSDFAARQARYIVNYIDGVNAENAGMENFTPLYLDSILPVEGLDTTVTIGNDYDISVHPNPFTSKVQADVKNNSGTDQVITLKLYNSFGTPLLTTDAEVKNTDTQTLSLETGDLPNGFYFLQFSDKDNLVFESRIIFKLP